jgi:hypothetical protein
VQFEAQYLTPERKRLCDVLFDAVGVHFRFGRKIISYDWRDIRTVSFDDPGRTKANIGAIALFGVLGLAGRQSFTLISISTTSEELFLEHNQPIAMWRSWARRLAEEEAPQARGRIVVNGVSVAALDTHPQQQSQLGFAAGWYADPSGAQALRWYDGTQWSEHTSPLPGQPT